MKRQLRILIYPSVLNFRGVNFMALRYMHSYTCASVCTIQRNQVELTRLFWAAHDLHKTFSVRQLPDTQRESCFGMICPWYCNMCPQQIMRQTLWEGSALGCLGIVRPRKDFTRAYSIDAWLTTWHRTYGFGKVKPAVPGRAGAEVSKKSSEIDEIGHHLPCESLCIAPMH